MTIVIKSLIGALIAVTVSLASQSKNYFLAGLVPLFPAFSLVAHLTVGQKGPGEFKETVLFGLLSIIPYSAYLLSVYFFSDRLPLNYNLLLSTLVWIIFAIVIYFIWVK